MCQIMACSTGMAMVGVGGVDMSGEEGGGEEGEEWAEKRSRKVRRGVESAEAPSGHYVCSRCSLVESNRGREWRRSGAEA